MKVLELLEDKREQKDARALRRDYARWKKLVNVPSADLRAMLPKEEGRKTGLSVHDIKAAKSYRISNTSARAILRMRKMSPLSWSTADINWMYRQLQYIDSAKQKYRDLPLVKDGKPTAALKNMWAWGHVPRGLKPTKFISESVELTEAMAIANVNFSADAKKNGENYEVLTDIDGKDFKIVFYPTHPTSEMRKAGVPWDNVWTMEFSVAPEPKSKLRKGSKDTPSNKFKMQNYNSGMEFKLLPEVLGYMKGFLQKIKPEAITIAADKSEQSRVSVYRRMLNRYEGQLRSLGYERLKASEQDVEYDHEYDNPLKTFTLVKIK